MVRKSLKKQNYKRKSGGGKFSKKNYKGYGKGNSKNNLQNKANQEFIKSLQKALIQGGAIGETVKNTFGNTHTEWRVIELTSAPSIIDENDKKPSFGGERKKVKQITARILDEKDGTPNYSYKKEPNGKWPEYTKPDVSQFNNNTEGKVTQTEFVNKHLQEVADNSAEYNTKLDAYYAAKDKFDKAQQAVKSYLSFNLNSARSGFESARNLLKSGDTSESDKFENEKNLSEQQKNQALDGVMPTEIEITEKLKGLITAIKTAKEEMENAKNAVNNAATKTTTFTTYIIASFYCDNITRVIKPNGLITF